MADSEEKLRNLLETTAKEHNYNNFHIEIIPVTSGGANYTANLYTAVISESAKPDLNIFAKVANLGNEIREKNEMLNKVYLIESIFYTELAVYFEKLYEKNNVPLEHRLTVPKYYAHVLTKNEETLLLENLDASGYKNFDRTKTIDWDYAAAAVEQMARLHAIALAFRENDPTEFASIASRLEVEWVDDGMIEYFMAQTVKNTCDIVSVEYKEKLQKFYSSKEAVQQLMARFLNDKTMLVHGDFRPSNLMHRHINGKLEVIPLDYQTLRLSTPVSDLMYFIFSGSDGEFRRLHYERLLEYYYTKLTNALQELHIDVENVYPKKTYERDLNDMLPFGLSMGLSMTAIVTVDPKDAPKIEGDVTDMLVKPNDLAKERISELVADFVRWGIL